MAKGKGGFIGQDGLNAPDSPTGVTASAGTGTITVSWTAPSDVGGSAITGYNVQASDGTNWYYDYDLELASYDSKSFTVSSQTGAVPTEVIFKTDGTKMYVQSRDNNAIYQYSLSTAWDVSTASYDSVSFSTSSQASNPYGFYIKPDGTKMYVCCINNERIYQYSLSTAWDISSASYDSVSFQVLSQTGAAFSVEFKTDGSKMYVIGGDNDSIFQYSLSTEWDLSTASYDSVSFDPASQTSQLFDAQFKPDGTKLYLLGDASVVYQYSLSTPWSLSSVSYDSISFSMSSQDSSGYGLFFGNEGGNLYLLGIGSDAVFQYTTGSGADYPTASPVTITGLTNGTSYTFNVWAINAFGWSSPSDASNSASPLAPLTGDIGLFWYSNATKNIDYITITSTGNAAEFGDCTAENASYGASVGNSTRAVHAGGTGSATNIMDYVNPVNRANAVDFGDYVYAVNQFSGRANNTRGIFSLAYDADGAGTNNVIAYITMATTGDAQDFGDLTTSRYEGPTVGSTTRCVFAKGYNGYNTIDYVAFATTGNATDFGDCQNSDYGAGGVASSTRGVWAGGATDYTMIEYITIASTGNATDFGDLNTGMAGRAAGADNGTRGVFIGNTVSGEMSYITIASTGNSLDFGDLTETVFSGGAGCSNCSGSLA